MADNRTNNRAANSRAQNMLQAKRNLYPN